jgi:hypothetical protein
MQQFTLRQITGLLTTWYWRYSGGSAWAQVQYFNLAFSIWAGQTSPDVHYNANTRISYQQAMTWHKEQLMLKDMKHEMREKLWGKEFADKMEKFESDLHVIQDANKDWFDSEENTLGDIGFHYILTRNQYQISFGFDPNSKIPPRIIAVCKELFNKTFS